MTFLGMGKKKEEKKEAEPDPASGDSGGEPPVPVAPPDNSSSGGNESADVLKLKGDVEKMSFQIQTGRELANAANEKITRLNEQVGELRAMIIDRDRATQHLEAKATQAIDMVESVQPDKLMIELRRFDTKIEALRATIESNETIVTNIITELKEMRNRLSTFKGIDEVIRLNEDVKKELAEIRNIKIAIEKHADKVETIFGEVQKTFGDYTRLSSTVKDFDSTSKQLSAEVEGMKVKVATFAIKKDLDTLNGKFGEFENKVGNLMTLLSKKFDNMEIDLTKKMGAKLERAEKLLLGFDTLAKKTPDLDKYFNLLDAEAKKAAEKEAAATVEKLKSPDEEEKAPSPAPAKASPLAGLNPFKK